MKQGKRRFFWGLVAVVGLMALSIPGSAEAKVRVGKACPPVKRVSIKKIDHSIWDRLLRKYVDNEGMVNYKAWKASKADRQALDRYLQKVGCVSRKKEASSKAKLAFWINIYNALTIKGILREYPTSSIRNHTARFFGYNIWKDLLLWVGGNYYSLDHVEHKILRKMGEPRIHFAIVCASIGCPRLLPQAYTAAKLEKQLKKNTHHFFKQHRHFRYNKKEKRFYLSSILKWFKGDFGKNKAERLKTIAPYLPSKETRQLARQNKVSISYLSYNWKLNKQKK